MENYVGVLDVLQKTFTWHWSMIGWGIALILLVLSLTRFWKYVREVVLIFNGVGWLCVMYAGFTGNWYIGWFAWVVPLSLTLFIKGMILRIENLPYESENKGKVLGDKE